MKGTCVEGTIPKLFRGKMVVCLFFMAMVIFCVVTKHLSPSLVTFQEEFNSYPVYSVTVEFFSLFCTVMSAQ